MKKENAKKIIEEAKTEIYEPITNNINGVDIKFNVNKLNDSTFKRLVLYYNDICGAPVEYVLTSCLCSLSGAIGKHIYYEITNNIKIYLNIWAVLIGKSTIMKKTTAINLAAQNLVSINSELYEKWKKEKDIYDKDSQADKTLKPPIREYLKLPEDSTIESLSDILQNTKRGILITNEFGGFLKRLGKNYSGDSKQFLTDIFDVPESYEISRMTREDNFIRRPFISIVGASTIEWFKSNSEYNDIKSGFFARFLFSIKNVNEKPYRALLELEKTDYNSQYCFDTADLFKKLSSSDEKIILKIDQQAKDIHIRYDIDSYKELLNSDNPNELSFKARLLNYSLKIAGVIAVVDGRFVITEKDINDSILICEYYRKNIEKLLNITAQNLEFSDKEEKILNLISKKGGEAKHSDLLNCSNEDTKTFTSIIDSLLQKEKIEIVTKRVNNSRKSGKYYKMI